MKKQQTPSTAPSTAPSITWTQAHDLCVRAQAIYEQEIAPFKLAYLDAIAPAGVRAQQAITLANGLRVAAEQAYEEEIAPVKAAYQRAIAAAWAKLQQTIVPATAKYHPAGGVR